MPILGDLLRANLRLVVCGTAAGARSAARAEYYAGKGNRFWPMLADIGLTPRRLAPSDYRELLMYGIGLTDVAKDQAGMDRQIAFDASFVPELRERIVALTPRVLCFNGKRAARLVLGRRPIEFGWQVERIGATALFCAPSTSAAAARTWSLAPWRELATSLSTL